MTYPVDFEEFPLPSVVGAPSKPRRVTARFIADTAMHLSPSIYGVIREIKFSKKGRMPRKVFVLTHDDGSSICLAQPDSHGRVTLVYGKDGIGKLTPTDALSFVSDWALGRV